MAEPDGSHGRAPVRVRAAGVNFLDILIRRGRYPQLPVGEAVAEPVGRWQTGAVRPVVGAEVRLAEAEQAHALVESRGSVGKVVLLP